MPSRNLLILLVTTVIAYACYVTGPQNPYARYVGRGLADIDQRSLRRVPSEDLFGAAMEAMVGELRERGDEHSEFIPRDEAQPFQEEMEQQFGGIGVRIRFRGDPPQLVVVGAPDPSTPADRAGLRDGDRILRIDDRPTEGMTMSQVLQAMRGEPGAPIRLLVRSADAAPSRSLSLIREVITVDSVLGDRRTADGRWEFRLEADPRIALVRVATFANRTAEELRQTLTQLTDAGVQAIVLDVRDDAGGALDTAVAICDMFLPGGRLVVETRGRDGVVLERHETTGRGKFENLPLAVLVNRNSASASEIVAACLQDHDRAVVGGERTFGKGTVQKLIPTESGRSLLKLTSASYWRPSGQNIHRMTDDTEEADWGVVPDPGFEVRLTDPQYEAYREYRTQRDLIRQPAADESRNGATQPADESTEFVDRQLQRAIEHLQSIVDDRNDGESNDEEMTVDGVARDG